MGQNTQEEIIFDSIEIWTDGACVPNPGKGGWGYVTREGHQGSGSLEQTTNQVMEIMAVVQALKAFDKKRSSITIISDSRYVINGATVWMRKWKTNGWKAKNGPVKHKPLWEELDALLNSNVVTFKWVKGHSGDEMNEKADQLATEALKLTETEIKKFHDLLFRRKAAKKAKPKKQLDLLHDRVYR